MHRPLLAGIDIGTTGSRCIVFDIAGERVGSAYEEYPLVELGDGWVEQSVPRMLEATGRVCAAATAACESTADIASVGISTQMSATCAVSESGELVRPMISWEDTRATAEVQTIAARCEPSRFKAITGGPLTAQLTISKILWLHTHEPATVDRTAVWSQVQDLALRFLGADDFCVDVPQAFAYGLWDVADRRWNDELLAIADVDVASLGRAVPAGTQVGVVSDAAAAVTGFAAGTPLCVGAGDQVCGMVGMGVTHPGVAAATIGTGGAMQVAVPEPRTDVEALFTLNHAVPETWALFAPTLSAASSYRWFRDVLGEPEVSAARSSGRDPFDDLDALAARSPAGSNGLVFLPYLSSAGAPRWNPAASGAFLGITQQTGRADLARSVMEGVVYEMRDNLERLRDSGLEPERVRLGGGATHSPLWTQIQADVYGMPVDRLAEGESTALGAALLGGIGAGVFDGYDDATDAMVHVRDTIEPDAAHAARYDELHQAYARASDDLAASTFELLAAARAGSGTHRRR